MSRIIKSAFMVMLLSFSAACSSESVEPRPGVPSETGATSSQPLSAAENFKQSDRSLGLILENRNDDNGWVVHSVVPGSPAEAAGVAAGDRLRSVNGADLSLDAPEDVRAKLSKSTAAVSLERNGSTINVALDSAASSEVYSGLGEDSAAACPCVNYSCSYPNCYWYDVFGYYCGSCYSCACT